VGDQGPGMGRVVRATPCLCVEQVVPVVGKRRRVCLKMSMGSGGIKGPESARALFRCGVYQTSGLGRGRCTLRRDGLLWLFVCGGLGDVATTQPRLVVARLEYNGRGDASSSVVCVVRG
jgi:hypothetical protein